MCLEMEQDLVIIIGLLIADLAGKHDGPVVLLNGRDRSGEDNHVDVVINNFIVVVELLVLPECECVVVTYISIAETILQNLDCQRLCEEKLLLKNCKIISSMPCKS